jgi:peptidoglycan/xylan/chitin deacetylase (PgdA/CDA1 family)
VLATVRNTVREVAKASAFRVLGSDPWVRKRLDRVRASGATTILNLHRVAPDDRSSYRPLSPALFEELLTFVKREFAVVTIGELSEKTTRPKLVLSFDDGYRDFATYAAPILRRHGLRSNQNIIPNCVETGLPPLNVLAQDFIGKAPRELVERLEVEGYSGPRDGSFGHHLSHFIKMRSQEDQDRLADQLVPQFFAYEAFVPTPMMKIEEVRSVCDQELGAHSWAHSSMEFETDDFLEEDVRRCAAFFRDKLAIPMTIYAFPNGSCRAGQAERVLAQDVEHVLLVGETFDRTRMFIVDLRLTHAALRKPGSRPWAASPRYEGHRGVRAWRQSARPRPSHSRKRSAQSYRGNRA